jgi:hypothetical protein
LNSRAKQIAKYVLKLGLSGLALWFVFTKVDWTELKTTWQSANVGFILLAIVLFLISKLASVFRLKLFLDTTDIRLGTFTNIKLQWLGMYYNLFLPGGAGGDGYKVYLLRKSHGKSIKSLTFIMILDRLGGLAAIFFILSIGSFFLDIPQYYYYAAVAILVLAPIIGRLLVKWIFPQFVRIYAKVLGWSMLFQLGQVAIATALLLALGQTDSLLEYVMLFLVSSIAAMLPISLGGLGAREVAMYYMAEMLSLNPALAMSISLSFYAITALVSLCGVYFSLNPKAMKLEVSEKTN